MNELKQILDTLVTNCHNHQIEGKTIDYTLAEIEAAHSAILQAHEQDKAREVNNLDHILSVMEAGKELKEQYEKYDGDMDWIEFVKTRYVDQLTSQGKENTDGNV